MCIRDRLDIVIKYNYKNDSQPAPKVFMKYDPRYYTEGQKITFTSPGKGTINFDKTPDQAGDYGNYYIQSYKADDTTISIGISISF